MSRSLQQGNLGLSGSKCPTSGSRLQNRSSQDIRRPPSTTSSQILLSKPGSKPECQGPHRSLLGAEAPTAWGRQSASSTLELDRRWDEGKREGVSLLRSQPLQRKPGNKQREFQGWNRGEACSEHTQQGQTKHLPRLLGRFHSRRGKNVLCKLRWDILHGNGFGLGSSDNFFFFCQNTALKKMKNLDILKAT